MPDNWFNYENEKQLQLPAVGSFAYFGAGNEKLLVKVVAHDLGCAVVRCSPHNDGAEYFATEMTLLYPLDFKKKGRIKRPD